jgi:hypothetical protein
MIKLASYFLDLTTTLRDLVYLRTLIYSGESLLDHHYPLQVGVVWARWGRGLKIARTLVPYASVQ